ncbi:glycosyltransferase [Vreelandella sp. TE19]
MIERFKHLLGITPRQREDADEVLARSEFDASWYLNANPDVREAGMDPWQHYWRHGRFENRLPRRNRALEWDHALWRGAHGVILARLNGLLEAPSATAAERYTARLALARWYRWQEQWDRVVRLLTPKGRLIESCEKLVQQGVALSPNPALILVEACCRFLIEKGGSKQYQAFLKQALTYLNRAFPETADTALANANARRFLDNRVEHAGFENEVLTTLNRFYTRHGLNPLVKPLENEPLALDNLSAAAGDRTPQVAPPLISVIVPVYNAASTLGTALQGLFAQQGVCLEIIAVDDASGDDSVAVVEHWQARCPGHVTLKLVRHEQNQGAYAARNTGAAHANAAFITIHDSDDWSHPEKLVRQAEALGRDESIKATLSYWVRTTPELLFHRWRLDEHGWVYPNISSLMVKREVVDTLGFWDEVSVNADTEYRQRIEAAFGPRSIEEVLPGIPVSFGRSSIHSLSQQSASHLASQFSGMRYYYIAAAKRWHAQANAPTDLYLKPKPGARPFYAPSAMLRATSAPPPGVYSAEDALQASALFDPGWYLARYVDLQSAMIEPFQHFCTVGSQEGRDPGPGFSTSGYRRRFEQPLQESGLEPWAHYLLNEKAGSTTSEKALPVWEGKCVKDLQPTVMLCGHQLGKTLFGAERSLLDVLEAMKALQWNVIVLLPEAGNARFEAMLLERCAALAVIPYGWWQQGKAPNLETVSHIERLIKRFEVKAVHANTLVLDEPLEAARQAGLPRVVHVRELPAHDEALRAILGASTEEIVTRVHTSADLIIANSSTVAKAFANSARGTSKAPIRVVPNTIDMAPLLALAQHPVRPAGEFWVGMLSSNVAKKGLDDIEAVAALLAERAPHIKFRLYGPPGPALSQLLARQEASGAPGNVVYAGYVESPEKALAEVDMVVNLSRFQESFGRTVLEAMAAGRPVVAYRWGAIPELVVNGRTGYLVAFAKTARVANKIEKLSRSPKRCQQMGEAGRARALSDFSSDTLKVALEQSYKVLNKAF